MAPNCAVPVPFRDTVMSRKCLCRPTSRVKGKLKPVCTGCCIMQVGGLEEALVDSVCNRRRRFDDTISERLWSLHPVFRRVVFFNGILSPPVQPVDCGVIKIRKAPISSAACQAFCSFICDGRWKWGTKHTQDTTSWVALAVEFVASFGRFQDCVIRKCLYESLSVGSRMCFFRSSKSIMSMLIT